MSLVVWDSNKPFQSYNYPAGVFFLQDGNWFDRNLQATSAPTQTATAYFGFLQGTGSGNKIWTGIGSPSDSQGSNGDLYIDETPGSSNYMYQKANGTWGSPLTPLRGADGADSAAATFKGWNITSGTPSASLGNISEAAVDPSTGLAWLPKQQSSAPTPNGFFGVNTHLNRSAWPAYASMTPASYQAISADAGIQIWRTDMTSASQITAQAAIINGWIANGQTPLIVITPASYDLLTATYASNYIAGQTLGVAMANAAVASISDPTKIYWECTNELDFACRVDKIGAAGTKNPVDGANVDGSVRSDFDHNAIERLRGLVGGLVAGIKSVIPTAKCGMATGNPYSFVVQEMLLKGIETTATYAWNYNGTVTATQTAIPFDFVCLHWYSTMFNAEGAGPSFHGSASSCPDKYASATSYPNVLSLLQTRCNGLPLIVSEWGTWDTEANQASYITSQYAVWFNNRATYNIKAVCLYVLFSDTADSGTGTDIGGVSTSNFGLIKADGSTKKAAYTALKNYNNGNTTPGANAWPTQPFRFPKVLASNNWDLVNGTNAQAFRLWGGIDPGQANGWYGTMYFGDGAGGGDGKLRIGCNKLGGSSAVLTRMVINGVDLVEFGIGGLNPIIANYALGYLGSSRFLRAYLGGINLDSKIITGAYTLANSSEPFNIIGNSASPFTVTMHSSPEHGEQRCFNNVGAGTMTVSYTGRTGTISKALAQDNAVTLQFNSTLNYWVPQ
jgi:hypothetical protein